MYREWFACIAHSLIASMLLADATLMTAVHKIRRHCGVTLLLLLFCLRSSAAGFVALHALRTVTRSVSEPPGFELDGNHVRVRILLRAEPGQLVHEVDEVHFVDCSNNRDL